ncbi:hypothetical protein E2C01_087715 [Portunus trituberculatus]|uniref:MADF domain-containing protein n=1 Tax=Portunus trituberculatus TaxID=210409 RepID=A0A5B7JEU3_PORTR|nr:hypothetical protein [Portunus trituberculatus]
MTRNTLVSCGQRVWYCPVVHSAVQFSWSKEITGFLETYQKRDLGDTCVDHCNKHRKQDAWEIMTKEMGTSVDVCKKKVNRCTRDR